LHASAPTLIATRTYDDVGVMYGEFTRDTVAKDTPMTGMSRRRSVRMHQRSARDCQSRIASSHGTGVRVVANAHHGCRTDATHAIALSVRVVKLRIKDISRHESARKHDHTRKQSVCVVCVCACVARRPLQVARQSGVTNLEKIMERHPTDAKHIHLMCRANSLFTPRHLSDTERHCHDGAVPSAQATTVIVARCTNLSNFLSSSSKSLAMRRPM
jgi:hypothetical protein